MDNSRMWKLAPGSLAAVALVVGQMLAINRTAVAGVELMARGSFSGTRADGSGLHDVLEGGIPHDRLGGLSALDYSGDGTRYLALSDRGPSDGAVPYHCRVHWLDVRLDPAGSGRLKTSLLRTILLRNERGESFVGDARAFDRQRPGVSLRLDPEGVRLGARGGFFISDEYGPQLLEFDASGRRLRGLPVPARFSIQHPSSSREEEATANHSGRQPNRGFEGVALVPGGRRLVAVLQGPLIQDSEAQPMGKRKGCSVRMLEVHLDSGRTREFLYPLDHASNGLSEIVAISDTEMLLIERDSAQGEAAKYKRIIHATLKGATDVSGIESLRESEIPPHVIAVQKHVLIDLLEPKFELCGPTFPEKVEGLCFGPNLADGRRMLMVGIDNDFHADAASWIYAFAVDPDELKPLAR